MTGIKESKELLSAFAGAARDFFKARADDGKVSIYEWVKLGTSNLAPLIEAFSGVGGVPAELADLTKEEIDELYYGFLKELEWEPTDDTRDKFDAFYQGFRGLVLSAILIKNTFSPPKAVVLP